MKIFMLKNFCSFRQNKCLSAVSLSVRRHLHSLKHLAWIVCVFFLKRGMRSLCLKMLFVNSPGLGSSADPITFLGYRLDMEIFLKRYLQ